ncbi:MAG: T9SS type A sorting domain-containing protein, partial [Paludibacteraceae bacterium]|nr:T9SS type A sorting domain-containing protein [Paludibacteraceae bacterium]
PLSFTFSHTDSLKCYGDSDGKLWLNRLEGGTPPYTVRWDWVDYNEKDSTLLQKRVNETQLLTDRLKAFRYALTVTDAHRCTRSSDTFAIHEPDEIKPSVSIRASNNVCPDDELDLATADAHGGTPPYEFIWKINDRFAYGENLSTLPFGKFRLSVRDANDCLVRREYTTEGPDTIRANARVIDVKCQGENTGAIELDPTGGTGDIQCRWTDAQGLEVTDLQHLAEGTYFLTMTDGLRCQAFDTAHVGTTSHIRFDHTAIQPSCYSLEDGALEVCARGGVEPYNWEGDCLRLEHIGRGMHPVSVTDAAGCVKDTLIELTAPESITPFLPERIALCVNQAGRTLRADTLAYPSATYVWTHDGDVTAEGPVCTVSRPGHYRLHMEYEGCTEDKDFEVQTLGDSIAAYFLVASFVPVDDDVRAVNLSRLPADKTEWLTSPNADIIRSDEREILLYFTEKGSAEIGLRTYKGACVAEYFQTLQIVDDDQVAAYDRFGSVVEQFTVSPNPSNGKFNVKVALNKAMSYTLTLLSGKNVMQTVSRNDSRGQIDAFQLEAVSGVYFIRLDIPDANIRQTRKIIVE